MGNRKFVKHDLSRTDNEMREGLESLDHPQMSEGSLGEAGIGDSIARDILFKPDNGLEKIIGEDDRTRILNTLDYPFRMLCKLTMQFPGSSAMYAGSGALIGPNLVLTAAHNLYDAQQGLVTSVTCAPGQADQGITPFGRHNVTTVFFPEAYKTEPVTKNDYALMVLDSDIGKSTGWFGYMAASDNALRHSTLRLTGYPGDFPKNGVQMWHHQSKVLEFDEHVLKYTADTFGGNSGGPIYIYDSEASFPWPLIFGIHTYGAFATVIDGVTHFPAHNGGRRIDSEVIDDLTRWRAAV